MDIEVEKDTMPHTVETIDYLLACNVVLVGIVY